MGDLLDFFQPDFAAPIVALLCSDHPIVPTGSIFESGGGFVAEWQWRRSEGVFFDIEKKLTVDDIVSSWAGITDMSTCTDPIEDDKVLAKQAQKAYEAVEAKKGAQKSKL